MVVVLFVVDWVDGLGRFVVVVVVVESSRVSKLCSKIDAIESSLRGATLRPSKLWSVFLLPNIPKTVVSGLLESGGKSKARVSLEFISFFAKYGLKYAVLNENFSLFPTGCHRQKSN